MMRHIFVIFLVVIIVGTLCGCTIEKYALLDLYSYGEHDKRVSFTKNEFLKTYDFPVGIELNSKYADLLKGGKLAYIDTVTEYPAYDINQIPWEIQFSAAPATCQLMLQSLSPAVILALDYDYNGSVESLEYSAKFIESYLEYINDYERHTEYTWNDHGVALRAENLIYCLLVYEESGKISENLMEDIKMFIAENAIWLTQTENYTEKHNHGIFQDRALIYSAYFLDNYRKEEWIALAKERLQQQMDFAYSGEMVNVENSYSYAIISMELFHDIASFLACNGDMFGKTLSSRIEEQYDFLAYLLKPNGYYAQTGDSHKGYLLDTNPEYADMDTILAYAMTNGQKGTVPNSNSKIFPESGYYAYREKWKGEDVKDATWLLFRAGYLSYAHKHGDDLSFSLYTKGKDVFIDPGYYNYSFNDPITAHLRSAKGHNTLIVDGESYPFLTLEYREKVGIYDYKLGNDYDYVLGFQDIYPGVSMERHLYNLGDAFIVFDDILSSEEHTYSQLFQCSEDTRIVKAEGDEVLLEILGTKYYVRIVQLRDRPQLTVYNGNDKNEEGYGVASYLQNQYYCINTLKFDYTAKNAQFVTLITIEDENGKIQNIEKIGYDDETGVFAIDGEKDYTIAIQHSNRDRVTQTAICKVDYEIKGNTFVFTNNTEVSPNVTCEYAWYVYDLNNKVIEKKMYSTDNTFTYTFPDNKDYSIGAFLLDENGVKRKETIQIELP